MRFCKGWLLKIKAERCRAGRFFIDVMKWSQVWVMQSLINCIWKKKVFEFIVKPPLIKWLAWSQVPVIRLLGSNTSILSNKSTAPGDMLRNRRRKSCLGNCGSCFMYLFALSLRRNPRLASSGEPMSFWKRKNSLILVPRLQCHILTKEKGTQWCRLIEVNNSSYINRPGCLKKIK